MSRLHPYDLVFAELADTWFGPIRDEAARRGRGGTPLDRSGFAALETVQQILGEVAGPDVGQRDPRAAGEYLLLIHVAYAYWLAGRPSVAATRERLETATGATGARAVPTVPNGACYVQLPERWAWGQVSPGEPHEPIDGVFVLRSDGGELTVLAILGLRGDRPGFSQLAVTATAEDVERAAQEVRTPALAPLMEGGDRAGFHSVASAADLLWLAHLALVAAGE